MELFRSFVFGAFDGLISSLSIISACSGKIDLQEECLLFFLPKFKVEGYLAILFSLWASLLSCRIR